MPRVPLRAMSVTWAPLLPPLLLALLALLCRAESRCSPTAYYKNCWIRRFPGVFIDIEESQRRGAQLLKSYREETALKCSRTCCLTRNFSCNLAIFHYDTSQENCFHLHCPTLESCILSHRGNVVLYNITKGLDPDLLVFGKYFTSNVRVLPHHYGRVNSSEQLPSDKRQFFHPPPPAAAAAPPLTSAPDPGPSDDAGGPIAATVTSTQSATSSKITAPPAGTPSVTSPSTPPPPPTSPTQSTPGAPTHQPMLPTPSGLAPNDTKGGVGRNHTAAGGEADHPDGGGGGDDDPPAPAEWHVAARTLLVAVAICAAVLLSCCCSALLVASWRGQRKRMGRYHTSWRGKRGSMRLMKYVLVRESS